VNVKELKSKIQLAVDAVQDVPDALKGKAFEIVLKKILATSEEPAVMGVTSINAGSEHVEQSSGLESKIMLLAQTAEISVTQLKDVFKFEEDAPIFIGRINGSEKEKQIQMSRWIILAFKDVYDKEWVDGSTLWKILKDYGVKALDNLAKNLKSTENEILAMGQRRDRKYKLTETGRQNALVALKQFIAG
jgi:hypothetical protein